MYKTLSVLLLLLITGCTENKKEKTEQVERYYQGFMQGNYKLVQSVLADSLTTISGDFTTPFTPETYHQLFQWDSVFKPKYTIYSIKTKGDNVIATITNQTSKFEFLKNNPLKLTHKFFFKDGKISKIEDFEYFDVNWDTWANSRDALTQWIALNHPELVGFENDLTKQGALNYLKAIELYEKNHP